MLLVSWVKYILSKTNLGVRYIHSDSHTQALYFICIPRCAVPVLLHMNAKDLENVQYLKLGIHWWS